MKKIILTKSELDNIYDLYYNSKKSMDFIHNKYNISRTALTRIFNENGWILRNRTDHFIKYSVNESYFDIIDTEDKAYILGLLAADGYNGMERNMVRIKLQERDKFVLDKINELTNNTRPLMFIDANKSNSNIQNVYDLLIISKHMCERLNELGITPRKSLTLQFPSWISKDLFPYYLRGYIDGDGWVQKYRIGLMSSNQFCYGLQSYLLKNYDIESHVIDMKRHYKKETKTWYISHKKNIYPLVNMMFKKCSIYIPRKVEKYHDYFQPAFDINNSLIA